MSVLTTRQQLGTLSRFTRGICERAETVEVFEAETATYDVLYAFSKSGNGRHYDSAPSHRLLRQQQPKLSLHRGWFDRQAVNEGRYSRENSVSATVQSL